MSNLAKQIFSLNFSYILKESLYCWKSRIFRNYNDFVKRILNNCFKTLKIFDYKRRTNKLCEASLNFKTILFEDEQAALDVLSEGRSPSDDCRGLCRHGRR